MTPKQRQALAFIGECGPVRLDAITRHLYPERASKKPGRMASVAGRVVWALYGQHFIREQGYPLGWVVTERGKQALAGKDAK